MLICKNCDTENNDGAVKCHHCQMGDKLVYLRPDANKFVAVTVDHNPLSCTNCGCEYPGVGDKCGECHFPIVGQVDGQSKGQSNGWKQNGQPILSSLPGSSPGSMPNSPFGILDEEDLKKLN